MKRWAIIGAVALLVIGVFLGQPIIAGSNDSPGSTSDPLVAKSYVDQALQEKVAQLEQQVATITQRAETLRAALNALEKMAGLPLTPGITGTYNPPVSTTTTTTTTPVSTPTTTTKKGTTTDPGTRVRTGPGTGYSIVAELPKGTEVTIVGEKSGWYNVKLSDGRMGYTLSSLITIK